MFFFKQEKSLFFFALSLYPHCFVVINSSNHKVNYELLEFLYFELWGLNIELWTLWYEPLMTTNYANYANAYCNVIRVIRVIRSFKS